jgi:hypothetical protein
VEEAEDLMRIAPDSVAGRRMIGWGVSPVELGRARLFRWDRQKGGAITVALPFNRALILMRGRYLTRGADGALLDGRHLALIRHEFCHVAQLQRWGFLQYWLRHLWARVRSCSVLAAGSDVEAPCYEAQRLAAKDFE